jgi:type I restriction enzyme S subunit
MEKQKNKPRLRFQEFGGEWEKKKLGEVAEKINSGKTPLGGESVYSETGVLFIRSQNVNADKLSFENSTFISEELNNTMKNSIVKANDILLNITGASLGRSCVVPDNFTIGNVNQHVCIIRLNKESNPRFVQPILSSTKGQNTFVSLQTGSGREGLNFESIKGIELFFPSLTEQTKIASFLTAVDEKLQSLKKKKSLLEEYKKGVMQKLFSQEIRFKDQDGNDFPDWEVKKFSNYIKLYRGSSPRPINKYITNSISGINWIKIGDTKSLKNNTIEQVSEKITPEGSLNSRKVEIGELILANSMSFGKTYLLNISGCIYDGWFVLREYENHFNKNFLMQLLNSEYMQKQYKTLSTGGVVQNISSDIVYSTNLFKPSIPEQTKIANFLSALDEKINHTQAQIEKTEIWKKGLLQRMFV